MTANGCCSRRSRGEDVVRRSEQAVCDDVRVKLKLVLCRSVSGGIVAESNTGARSPAAFGSQIKSSQTTLNSNFTRRLKIAVEYSSRAWACVRQTQSQTQRHA